ncbi:MAG: hypothetical protein OZ948_03920 [Deltaproteobacteria bacterium]|nr:hypothetical protein [Deltaproteobacteria bacterium]
MIRWLTLLAGVGVAAAALHALLSAPGAPRSPGPVAARAARAPAHGEIDEASRARLEQVLREADAGEPGR